MSFLTEHHTQTATLWTVSGRDNFGDPTFDDSVEISVRWEERTAIFVDDRGETRRSRAVVYLGRDVNVGDYLLLGSLTQSTDNPLNEPDAMRIEAFRKIPSLDGNDFERRAML